MRFGAGAVVLEDRLDQVVGAAVVQEVELVAQAPERGGAPIAAAGTALGDAVGEVLAHGVDGEVGVEADALVAERGGGGVAGLQGRGVAHGAAESVEMTLAPLVVDRLGSGGRAAGREEAHEGGEGFDIGGSAGDGAGVIFGEGVGSAGGVLFALGGEEFVGDAFLYVVGFAAEREERFVLRLPTEAGDGAVVAAGVEGPADAEGLFARGVRGQVGAERGIGDGFDEAEAVRSGVGMRKETLLTGLLKSGCGEGAAYGGRRSGR